MADTQNERILAHLQAGQKLSPMDALKLFGCFRLAARINDLRRAGHKIDTETGTANGKSFAVYKLVPPRPLPEGTGSLL